MSPQPARSLLRCVVAIAAAALLLAACGGGPSGSLTSQRAAVRRTIVTFMREFAAGNGTVACEGLTVGGAASLTAAVGPELGNFGINGCVAVIGATASELNATLRNELETVTVGTVALHGSNATVRWSALPRAVATYFSSTTPLRVIWEHNFWYINGF
jgi:hypothetical protein